MPCPYIPSTIHYILSLFCLSEVFVLYLRIMKKIKVSLGERSYEILVGNGVASKLPGVVRALNFAGPIVFITDRTVLAKTAALISPILNKLSNEVYRVIVPSSESSKSVGIYQEVVQKITRKTRMHRPLIVALGGGVVGDLAGFVAATYRRGVPIIQIPTTLLAMVDSSIGGKVGIDLPEAKNLIGAFKQPSVVLMDPNFLKTLPIRQLRNGLAEIIKYGIISNRTFFNYLEENVKKILSLDKKVIENVICECASIKAGIVKEDEFDLKDIRIILNFGHTLGHAIETASGYSVAYNHGESIAIGMVMAGEIAVRLEMIKVKDLERIKALLKNAGLQLTARNVPFKEVVSSFLHDKKFIAGSNRFVLPVRIGSVKVVDNIPELLIKSVIRQYVK